MKRTNIQFHEDDRAQRLLNIFDDKINGQLNVSYINSTEHVVCWHRHKKQTDYWVCLKGSLKVGLAYETKNGVEVKWEYLSDKNFQVLEIPPTVYHGYKALEEGTILLYYLDKKYDPSDEFREKMGAFNENWNIENK